LVILYPLKVLLAVLCVQHVILFVVVKNGCRLKS
jgi:hypothetical protein